MRSECSSTAMSVSSSNTQQKRVKVYSASGKSHWKAVKGKETPGHKKQAACNFSSWKTKPGGEMTWGYPKKHTACSRFWSDAGCPRAEACQYRHVPKPSDWDSATPVCKEFARTGYCSYENCNFEHVREKLDQPCRDFQKFGSCNWGDACRFQHVPVEKIDQPCWDFQRGECKRGMLCRFQHVKSNAYDEMLSRASTQKGRALKPKPASKKAPASTKSARKPKAVVKSGKLCPSFAATGFCEYEGEHIDRTCKFSHDRSRCNWKAPCREYLRLGACPYGSRCRLEHLNRKQLCHDFKKGKCKYGFNCSKAHVAVTLTRMKTEKGNPKVEIKNLFWEPTVLHCNGARKTSTKRAVSTHAPSSVGSAMSVSVNRAQHAAFTRATARQEAKTRGKNVTWLRMSEAERRAAEEAERAAEEARRAAEVQAAKAHIAAAQAEREAAEKAQAERKAKAEAERKAAAAKAEAERKAAAAKAEAERARIEAEEARQRRLEEQDRKQRLEQEALKLRLEQEARERMEEETRKRFEQWHLANERAEAERQTREQLLSAVRNSLGRIEGARQREQLAAQRIMWANDNLDMGALQQWSRDLQASASKAEAGASKMEARAKPSAPYGTF